MKIEIINQQKKFTLSPKKVKTNTEKILRLLGLKDKSLSILLTDDRRIRKLNQTYLGKNRATDVLAFSMVEGIRIGDENLLGDVVVSVDTAGKVAGYLKRSFEEELYLYIVHGILHLVGYRDSRLRERREMEELQDKILEAIL